MRPFAYTKATTPSEAVQAITSAGHGTRFLSGGTTLFDLMKLNVETPAAIVDVNAIDELSDFDTSGSDELVFGALARMSDVAADARLIHEYPALSESLWRAASQQLRNMASVGGNLLQRTRCEYFRNGEPFACNKRKPGSGCAAIDGIDRGHAVLGGSSSCIATYPGDWAIALVAFDAVIDVLGPKGTRTIPVEQLHREPGDTPHIEHVLEHDELILRIRVPTTSLGRASTFHKIRDRESYAFALASAAVAIELAGDMVKNARIAIGGLATRPWRAHAAETELVGKRLTEDSALITGRAALDGAKPGRSNGFRIELGARTVADALMIAKQRAMHV
ncbi:MAG TPA: xanthine dehydrogenase family protein subunit M [Gemmatimonadaceae bacterium]